MNTQLNEDYLNGLDEESSYVATLTEQEQHNYWNAKAEANGFEATSWEDRQRLTELFSFNDDLDDDLQQIRAEIEAMELANGNNV